MPKIRSTLKPESEQPKRHGTTERIRDLVAEIEGSRESPRRITALLKSLRELGVDTADAEAEWDDYRSIRRSDFDTAEDYAEERDSVWESFLDALETAVADLEEEEEERAEPRTVRPVAPSSVPAPKGKRGLPTKTRFWCPLCGQMADDEVLEGSPYPVETVIEEYGGRAARSEWETQIGARVRGYIAYYPDPERREEVLARMLEIAKGLVDFIEQEMARSPRERGGRKVAKNA